MVKPKPVTPKRISLCREQKMVKRDQQWVASWEEPPANSWQRSIDWWKQIELRGEEIEKRIKKKERTVGKKLTFEKGEEVLVQDLKTQKLDTKGTITEVRVSDDRTVSSYDLMIWDLLTTRHRWYLAKLKNASEADFRGKDKGEAPARSGSQP